VCEVFVGVEEEARIAGERGGLGMLFWDCD
jgi:hypothetical protein